MRVIVPATRNSIFVFIMSAIISLFLGCSDVDSVPKSVKVFLSDLGESKVYELDENGIIVQMEVCLYSGKCEGFWGSETSPPFNVCRRILLIEGSQRIEVESKWVVDLCNLNSTSLVAVNKHNNIYTILIRGGDGIFTYESVLKINEKGTVILRDIGYRGP